MDHFKFKFLRFCRLLEKCLNFQKIEMYKIWSMDMDRTYVVSKFLQSVTSILFQNAAKELEFWVFVDRK